MEAEVGTDVAVTRYSALLSKKTTLFYRDYKVRDAVCCRLAMRTSLAKTVREKCSLV